jgi:hypothetical protein
VIQLLGATPYNGEGVGEPWQDTTVVVMFCLTALFMLGSIVLLLMTRRTKQRVMEKHSFDMAFLKDWDRIVEYISTGNSAELVIALDIIRQMKFALTYPEVRHIVTLLVNYNDHNVSIRAQKILEEQSGMSTQPAAGAD